MVLFNKIQHKGGSANLRNRLRNGIHLDSLFWVCLGASWEPPKPRSGSVLDNLSGLFWSKLVYLGTVFRIWFACVCVFGGAVLQFVLSDWFADSLDFLLEKAT